VKPDIPVHLQTGIDKRTVGASRHQTLDDWPLVACYMVWMTHPLATTVEGDVTCKRCRRIIASRKKAAVCAPEEGDNG